MTVAVAILAAVLLLDDQGEAPGPASEGTVRDLILLADDRPVFLRLRISVGDRPSQDRWLDSIGMIHATLDRDRDGTLSAEEAAPETIAALIRLATGAVPTAPVGPADADGDGVVTVDELASAIGEAMGPIRLQVDRPSVGGTDALFDQLDRDRDGFLTDFELGTAVGTLRRLDLDDDEMISADELEAFRDPAGSISVAGPPTGRARPSGEESVLERSPGESTLRLSRVLLRRYDTVRGELPGPPDSRLSPDEFAIDPAAFDEADENGDGSLGQAEVRRFLDRTPVDVVLDVAFPADASARPTIRAGAEPGWEPPEGVEIASRGEGDVRVDVGHVRLDLHLDGGEGSVEAARRDATARFSAADANEDGSLSPEERAASPGVSAAFAGLFDLIDRDCDDTIDLEELDVFVDRQAEAARGRLLISASDQGRAIFAIVDEDGDLRLGAREMMGAVARVSSWDRDLDGRVSAGEIPYHFRLTVSRSRLAGLLGGSGDMRLARPNGSATVGRPGCGPSWFRRMDRNDDGDVSRREFLGTRSQFDLFDRDGDGLIDPAEAEAGTPGPP